MEQDNRNRLHAFETATSRRLNSRGQGYTFFVKITKLLLPIVALVLVTLVTLRLSGPMAPSLTHEKDGDTKTEAGQIELEGAEYRGSDEAGRHYTVSADIASRDPDDKDTVVLTTPKAVMALSETSEVSIMAKNGRFNTETSRLQLDQDVRLLHNDGYELRMPDLDVNVTAREAVTQSPVEGSGPAGTLTAAGLSVENKGDLIIFKGPAVLTIIQKPAVKTDQSPQEIEG